MGGKYLKQCPICGGEIEREKTAYVVGRVVVEPEMEADVCTKCGEEFYTAEQVVRAQEKARRLGLFPSTLEEDRELKQLGCSLIVSIPKPMVRALNLAPGEKVRLRLTESGISITKERSGADGG